MEFYKSSVGPEPWKKGTVLLLLLLKEMINDLPVGFTEKVVPGDGNCYFHCLSRQRNYFPEFPLVTRNELVRKLRNSQNIRTKNCVRLVSQSIEKRGVPFQNVEQFLNYIDEDKAYFPLDLSAAVAEEYCIKISIWIVRRWETYTPRGQVNSEIFITFINGNHYNLLVPVGEFTIPPNPPERIEFPIEIMDEEPPKEELKKKEEKKKELKKKEEKKVLKPSSKRKRKREEKEEKEKENVVVSKKRKRKNEGKRKAKKVKFSKEKVQGFLLDTFTSTHFWRSKCFVNTFAIILLESSEWKKIPIEMTHYPPPIGTSIKINEGHFKVSKKQSSTFSDSFLNEEILKYNETKRMNQEIWQKEKIKKEKRREKSLKKFEELGEDEKKFLLARNKMGNSCLAVKESQKERRRISKERKEIRKKYKNNLSIEDELVGKKKKKEEEKKLIISGYQENKYIKKDSKLRTIPKSISFTIKEEFRPDLEYLVEFFSELKWKFMILWNYTVKKKKLVELFSSTIDETKEEGKGEGEYEEGFDEENKKSDKLLKFIIMLVNCIIGTKIKVNEVLPSSNFINEIMKEIGMNILTVDVKKKFKGKIGKKTVDIVSQQFIRTIQVIILISQRNI